MVGEAKGFNTFCQLVACRPSFSTALLQIWSWSYLESTSETLWRWSQFHCGIFLCECIWALCDVHRQRNTYKFLSVLAFNNICVLVVNLLKNLVSKRASAIPYAERCFIATASTTTTRLGKSAIAAISPPIANDDEKRFLIFRGLIYLIYNSQKLRRTWSYPYRKLIGKQKHRYRSSLCCTFPFVCVHHQPGF